nr:immunoglobulin heavy chain junction region [Macaca mulatta]MOX04559.1 immunoglobulin heavy chain junction region [Macaca mulatta]
CARFRGGATASWYFDLW